MLRCSLARSVADVLNGRQLYFKLVYYSGGGKKRGLAHARLAMASCGVSNLALKLARGATELVLIAVLQLTASLFSHFSQMMGRDDCNACWFTIYLHDIPRNCSVAYEIKR